jgi:hypothetical protein
MPDLTILPITSATNSLEDWLPPVDDPSPAGVPRAILRALSVMLDLTSA